RGSYRLAATISAALVLGLFAQPIALAAPSAPAGYDSSYAGESVFTAIGAGGSGQMSAIFFNSGSQPWAPGVVGLLVCLPDKTTCGVASPNVAYMKDWVSPSVYATITTPVLPGQNGFFVYNFVVPASASEGA